MVANINTWCQSDISLCPGSSVFKTYAVNELFPRVLSHRKYNFTDADSAQTFKFFFASHCIVFFILMFSTPPSGLQTLMHRKSCLNTGSTTTQRMFLFLKTGRLLTQRQQLSDSCLNTESTTTQRMFFGFFWQLGDYLISNYNSATVTVHLNEPFSPRVGNTISYLTYSRPTSWFLKSCSNSGNACIVAALILRLADWTPIDGIYSFSSTHFLCNGVCLLSHFWCFWYNTECITVLLLL